METFCQLLQSHINLWRNVVFGTKRKRVLSLFSPEPNWFCRDRIPFTGHPWGDFYNWPEKPFQPYWGSFGSVEIVREELRQPSLAKSTQFCAFLDQVDWKHIFLDYFKISFKWGWGVGALPILWQTSPVNLRIPPDFSFYCLNFYKTRGKGKSYRESNFMRFSLQFNPQKFAQTHIFTFYQTR